LIRIRCKRDKVQEWVDNGTITEEEKKYILGEE